MPPSLPLRVLFLCAEADPLVKIGGLGDVGGSLPVALSALNNATMTEDRKTPPGIDLRVVLPFHGSINPNRYKIQPVAMFSVPHTSGAIKAKAYSLTVNHVQFYLIAGDPISPQAPVYSSDLGYDAHKYIFFSLAALELARQLGWQPHVLHANDWHTAPAVYWLSLHRETDEFFRRTAMLQSVHNLPYLGVGAGFPMESFNLPPAPGDLLPEWARHLPLPLALLTADYITTVSPTYAKEILSTEFGSGLEALLRKRADRLSGILNGIDYRLWNPADDPAIPVTYTPESLFVREANKAALLNELGFIANDTGIAEGHIPLLAMISRMDYQKGVDIAIEAIYSLSRSESLPWRVIFLGTGLAELEQSARRLQWYLPDRVRSLTRFDSPLSHRLYAAADLLMMPSRYEACGLTQMIAQRYGCVPVARATGGLNDTISDYRSSTEGTGFLFNHPTPEALAQSLITAMDIFQNRPIWQGLQKRGMEMDFSWNRSAHQYYNLYTSLVAARQYDPI